MFPYFIYFLRKVGNRDNWKMNFAFVAGVVVLLNTVNLSLQAPGSTPKIKEIVLGRCFDFQNEKLGPDKSKWKDCNKIWEAFHKGFAYKNPCKLTQDDYKPFFSATGMQEIHDKVMNDLEKNNFSAFWKALLIVYRAQNPYRRYFRLQCL